MSWHITGATQTLTFAIVDVVPHLFRKAMTRISRDRPGIDVEQAKKKKVKVRQVVYQASHQARSPNRSIEKESCICAGCCN